MNEGDCTQPAFAEGALVPLQRRGARFGEAPAMVDEGIRAAPVLEAVVDEAGGRRMNARSGRYDAVRSRGGAVVGAENDDGILQLAAFR